MTGACIIDGTDIATLGMFITWGGDSDFVAYPTRNEPVKNDWFEHDGIEVDFDTLNFKPKQIKVEYYLSAPDTATFKTRLNSFETLHYTSGTRDIYIREFDRTFNLRFTGISNYKHTGGLFKTGKKAAFITVVYSDDNPTALFNPTVTTPAGVAGNTRVLINGTDMAAYGIIIEEFYNTALRIANPKQGIVYESAFMSGVVSDTAFTPQKKQKALEMKCTLIAGSLSEFWQNYQALFNKLRGSITITLTTGEQINCYYKSMTGIKKVRPFNTKIQLGFNLKFTVI